MNSAFGVARKIGFLFVFTPQPVIIGSTTTTYDPIEAGLITKRDMKNDVGAKPVQDDRDGPLVAVGLTQTKYQPSYSLTTQNTNAQMMALYYRGLPPVTYTQAASTGTAVPHTASPGCLVAIVDANGNRIYGLTAITSISAGSTPLVRGVDYDYTPGDLDRGYITILTTSTVISSAHTAITITYSVGAITNGMQIVPLSGGCSVQGYGEIWGGSCEGQYRQVETGLFAVTLPSMDWPTEDNASISMDVMKLSNSGSNYPNGQVLLLKGAI